MGLQFQFGDQCVRVNVATRVGLEHEVKACLRNRHGFAMATINLDHLVKLSSDRPFLDAYNAHEIVVADGHPIVWLSRLAKTPVSLMPGSDMIRFMCEMAASQNARVALVGSTRPALDAAAEKLCRQVPGLDIAWVHAPGVLDPDGDEVEWILKSLQSKNIGLCFLALGAPKQERIAARGRQIAPNVGFVSVGAGLDFISGHQRRAPKWVRDLAFEWLWRALSSPSRLGPRYLKCLAIFPGQLLRALRMRFQGAHLYSKISRR